MSQIFETGHVKNVASLLKLNQTIATFGNTYNPGNATITSNALNTLYNNSNAAQSACNNAENTWNNATNARKLAFKALPLLCTKLLGALESTPAPQPTIDDMKSLVGKMRGERLTKADAGKNQDQQQAIPLPDPNAPPEEDNTISTSHRSYDNQLDHFSKMILLLQSVPGYAPNEPSLQIPALQTLLNNLTVLNNAANTSIANLRSARIARNLLFYAADTGMLDRARKVKSYVKSIYGAASQQYAAVRAIKFVRVISKKKAK